ncbi:uncharacterized protein E0L32_006848 [Thyridium curvatum]|uniref:Autophagy-related protein 33 n=1 Tax=Thyridium curvatum TaxID=1093900 RepID=A0A507B037_9PEZI|nr:uncharacterized protein E0L32_006848 [Thyridium curvatum]TPX12436.1 hypothetical protein E0L32_006848 [Thyridium curvatum]
MASRKISVLKLVGTVSLGLLTGLSYTLSTLTVPTLLTLPSADTASRAFRNLADTAKRHLRALASVSAGAFMLAYIRSPRAYRHPYLLYTSLLVIGSRLVTSDFVAPYLFLAPRTPETHSSPSAAAARRQQARQDRAAARAARMEASYEVLGDSHSEGAGSEDTNEVEEEVRMNGEDVRGEVEGFLKRQVVQTAMTGLGFLMAVVGIWGDGAVRVFQSETFVIA